jgi:hypothetical protein
VLLKFLYLFIITKKNPANKAIIIVAIVTGHPVFIVIRRIIPKANDVLTFNDGLVESPEYA